jgi:hypothetical protein
MKHNYLTQCFALLTCALLIFVISNCAKSSSSTDDGGKSGVLKTNVNYTVVSIDQFDWITGSSAWIQDSKSRLKTSKFKFKTNGEMTYVFDFDASNTYTLTGEYFENGSGGYEFYAVRNTSNGAGSGTQVIVEGTINSGSDGQFKVNMEYGSAANYSAYVNNQSFFSQASKRFSTTITIE